MGEPRCVNNRLGIRAAQVSKSLISDSRAANHPGEIIANRVGRKSNLNDRSRIVPQVCKAALLSLFPRHGQQSRGDHKLHLSRPPLAAGIILIPANVRLSFVINRRRRRVQVCAAFTPDVTCPRWNLTPFR